MKPHGLRFLFLAFVSIASIIGLASTSDAGPNANGTLILHDAEMPYDSLSSEYCGAGSAPPVCESADTRIDGTDIVVWKAYAAFPENGSPRLKALTFGVEYNDSDLHVVATGPCAEFELPSPAWPAPGTGTSVVFTETQTNILVEVYWFAGYLYSGTPQLFELTVNPDQGGYFADDSVPSILDEIADFGVLGFGAPGYLPCPGAIPLLGACCAPDGSCTIVYEHECWDEWLGEGTGCDPNPCPQPPQGACCFELGDCVVTTELDCDGEWLGEGTDCDPNPCPQPPEGACCRTDGSCTVTFEVHCTGEWLGEGTQCDPNPCPEPGACCFELGECVVTTEFGCEGEWLGEGTDCDPNPCPQPPVGACCHTDGSCTVTPEVYCMGEWLGEGTQCDPNPCPQPPLGACCAANGTCTITIEVQCTGDWLGAGTSCDPNPCAQPPLGACCLQDGSCVSVARIDCPTQIWYEGVPCDPDPCPAQGACCTGLWCEITTLSECTGDWQGPGTVCSPNPCCPSPDPPGGGTPNETNVAPEVGSGHGVVVPSPERDNPCPGSTLLENADGSYESGYAWQYGGVVPPDGGAFAEGYTDFGTVCGVRFYFTTLSGLFINIPMDVYVWDGDGSNPGNVLSLTPGVRISPPAIWPNISTHDVDVQDAAVSGSFFVGYWGDWPGGSANWYVATDLDGPGGLPRTHIAPCIGYPTGWHDPSIVWGPTQALGIGAYIGGGATPVQRTTWGRIKDMYK